MTSTEHSDNPRDSILFELEELLNKRKKELPENSYTTRLFRDGADKIIQKVGEEAVEVLIASKNSDRDEIILETADLIYHLLVLLAEKEISLDDVLGELANRRKG